MDLWIGVNKEKGYVILDRDLPANYPSRSLYYFINCSDWTVYEEDKKNWDEPLYVYSPETEEANKYKKEYIETHKEKIWLPLLEKIFKTHRKEKGYPNATLVRSSKHRSSHCWNCKNNVDNAIDYECSLCRWIVCSVCGSCKLGGC